jgi:phosphate transport system protein
MERTFDRELKEIKNRLSVLADTTTRALTLAAELVVNSEPQLFEQIEKLEKESDSLETSLQKKAATLLALHQPVASDLRLLLSSMNVAHELERIADQCLNIAQRMEESRNFRPFSPPAEIYEMIERAKEITTLALNSYFQEDAELAREAIRIDIFLDDLKSLITSKYLEKVKKKEINPGLGVVYILLSRHLEKIGDLAKNIAEEAFYLITGEFIRHLQLNDLTE